jgi:hypothetical protein
MMIRRVWIKTIGDNASSAIIDRGRRLVTLPNSSASAPPRPLRSANGGPPPPRRRLGMRDNVPAWWPILRALAPLLAAFPAHGGERPSVVGRSTPYKDPARDGLHRLKKPGACRGIRSVPTTLFSYWRHSRTNRGNVALINLQFQIASGMNDF